MPQPGETRVEYNYTWVWTEGAEAEPYQDHWKSTKGNLVRIFPPRSKAAIVFIASNQDGAIQDISIVNYWLVTVCDVEAHPLTGEDAEERAFCIAEVFTRQQR